MLPGEYPSPLVRTTVVHAPMVSGYTTARLFVQGSPRPPALPLEDHTTQVILENVSEGTFSVQILQTQDRSPSGVRTSLTASPITLTPGGRRTLTIVPSGYYLEFKATSVTGRGVLKAQLASKLKWDVLAFSKDEQPPAFNAGYETLPET